MHLSNKYYAGGFVIETTFSFSFFIKSDAPATSTWVAGKINENDDSIKHTVFKKGRIAIDKENNVTIELFQDEDKTALYFVAIHVIGLLSQRQQLLPLHASAIMHEGQAILFTGLSGSGKSTCVNVLSEKGFVVISDEMAPLQNKHNSTHLLPTCQGFYSNTTNDLNQKKWHPISPKITHASIPVKSIYHLQFEKGEPKITHEKSINAIKILQTNHFKPFLKWDKESNLMRYELCTKIIENCEIKSFKREKNIHTIQEAMEILIKDF